MSFLTILLLVHVCVRERESERVCLNVCLSVYVRTCCPVLCVQFVGSVSCGCAHRRLGHVHPGLHPPLHLSGCFPFLRSLFSSSLTYPLISTEHIPRSFLRRDAQEVRFSRHV